jgi:hypothetical protein
MYCVISVKDTIEGTFVILKGYNKEHSRMGNKKRSKVRRDAGELQHWLCVCMYAYIYIYVCVCVCVCVLSFDSMILRGVQGGC